MYRWSIEEIELPLSFTWKISRGASQKKRLFFIKVSDGKNQALGEVAGITRDGEKADDLLSLFDQVSSEDLSLEHLLKKDLPCHLKFGMTSALTHLECKKSNQSLAQYFGHPKPSPVPTTFSLPILEADEVAPFFEKFNLSRFPAIKIKIGKDKNFASVLELHRIYKGPLRVDANEAFENCDEVLDFCTQIKHLPLEFMEQPLPAELTSEYRKLKPLCPFPVFADESLQDQDLPEDYNDLFDGINVKLMKASSYQQALKQIEQAHAMGLKVMLGCMVESSLGIAGAISISQNVDYFDLDSFMYFQNDPHSCVIEKQGLVELAGPFPN